ncbi:hypothetical protein KA078_02480 [Candidatus Woesebacteria bacterium]|nr:hypothetical protein [Candidatus Woesebacteria bacterium]
MKNLNASSRIMYTEAEKMGIKCTTFGDNETILMEKDSKQWYVRGSRTSLQSSVGKTIADYKPLTKNVLLHFGLPTARGLVVQSEAEVSTLSGLTFPLVMKPVDERHGKGVVVGIKTIEEAQNKFKEQTGRVLFEEMLEGTEYRIVCVDYQFLAASFRKPAHVVGDGSKTISELIAEKNKHPWRSSGHSNNLSLIEVDDMVRQYLAEQNLTEASIPESGREVLLRKTANLSTGGEAWDVTDTVCAENKALFEQIARVCDLSIIGIDIMCSSLETPLLQQEKAGVIEVNASPGLRMHHFPMQGTPRNVAAKILQFCIQKVSPHV